jgi:hypothetical protein
LEQAGFTPVVCHAQGKGDKAMEEMIDDGVFAGVLDLCIGGVMEHLFGGNRDPGPNRLLAAVRRGIPMVVAPCGLDILSYGRAISKTRCASRSAPAPMNCVRPPTSLPNGSIKQRGRLAFSFHSRAGRRSIGRGVRSMTRPQTPFLSPG